MECEHLFLFDRRTPILALYDRPVDRWPRSKVKEHIDLMRRGLALDFHVALDLSADLGLSQKSVEHLLRQFLIRLTSVLRHFRHPILNSTFSVSRSEKS